MAFSFFKILKGLLISEENSLVPKQIEIIPGGTANTKTTIISSQTNNKIITVPDATDTLIGKATTDILTNKSLSDTTTAIVDVSDVTKKIIFDASGATATSTTITGSQTVNRVLTLPDATDTIIGKATTDILTNKSLVDTSTAIVDAADSTKKILFDASGATATSTTFLSSQTVNRTLTLPDITDTLISKTSTDILTNKSLSDTTTAFVDAADATKKILFDAAGATATSTTITSSQSVNRTLTLPDATDVLVGKVTTDLLSNKSLVDSSTTIVDAADNTKKILFDASGATGTSTTLLGSQSVNRTLTLPDATDTLVGKITTDTLSNKTLDNTSVINVKDSSLTIQDAADATKQIKLDAGGAAATSTTILAAQSANRTITLPDATDTLVGKATADTLTSKTIVVANNTITTAASGNLAATELNTALAELQTDVDTRIIAATATTKGDLLVRDAGAIVRQPVGANGTFLKANSGTTTGIEWGSVSFNLSVVAKSTTYTATTADDVILVSATADWTLTLPTAVGNTGKIFRVKKTDATAFTVTIDPDGTQTLDGLLTYPLIGLNNWIAIISDGANWLTIAASEMVYVVAHTATNAASATAPIIYSTEVKDNTSGYDPGTGRFTVKLPGTYHIIGTGHFGATTADCRIHIDGAEFVQGTPPSTSAQGGQVSAILPLVAGHIVDIRPNTAATATGGAGLNRLSITRIGN